ncbi:hypothetical protein HDU79_011981, partial [Rhizoclosmatium sp. JEL0117]
LKEAKSDLSQAHGAAALSAISTIAAQQDVRPATYYTLEQMDLLKDRLKPVDFDFLLSEQVIGRTWFSAKVKKWLDGSKSVFWLRGPAGCGKSRMAETALNLFKEKEQDPIFFAFHHKIHHDPRTCIETIAFNVAEKYNTPSTFEIARAIFSKCEAWEKEPSKKPEDLYGLVKDLIVTPLKHKNEKLVLVIDALDECDTKSLKHFLKILGSPDMTHNFRLFVTCRDPVKWPFAEEYIFDPMSEENLHDLAEYVQGKLMLETVLSEQVADYTKLLVDKSQGNFLNASLALDVLCIGHIQYEDFKRTWDSLMQVEVTSESLYDNVWTKVADNQKVCKLVGIMLLLTRPLTLNGLAKMTDIDENPLKEALAHIVPLLKVIPKNDNDTVQFKHRTTAEFLMKRVHLQPGLLAEKCMELIGLLLGSLDTSDYSKAVNSFASRTNKFNFGLKSDATLYFIENWTDTLETWTAMLENGTDMLDVSTHLIQSKFQQFTVKYGNFLLAACIKMRNESFFLVLVQNSASINNLENSDFFNSPVLYEAAKLGLATVCKCLLELESETVDVNCIGNTKDQYGEELGQTPLHVAVRSNHLETVKSPLQRAIYDRNFEFFKEQCTESGLLETNQKDVKNTGFHYLAIYYDSRILGYVSKLSNFAAGLSCVNSDGETPLSLAAKKGNKKAVELFLEHGANIESQNNERNTPLALAAFKGHKDIVQLLLLHKANIESQNKNGNTPLAIAVQQGHKETVKFLLDCGSKIESQDNHKNSPLALAAQMGHKETVELLLKSGANVESQNKYRETPLTLAAEMEHVETVEVLIDCGANIESQNRIGSTPLARAAYMGHMETAELLLLHKANIEAQNKKKETPLALAAEMGHKETIELLLDWKADIEFQDNAGDTPLARAASMGHKETVELLLKSGANIESQNKYRETPLTLAAKMGHKETVKVLIDCGANIESHNHIGNTPLALAAGYGHNETLELLLLHKANIESQNRIGSTPLALAASMGHMETAELLLLHKANIEAQNNERDTPLSFAAFKGHKDIVQLLLLHKANIESQNKNGNTPLALAAINGHKESVELLLDGGAKIESQNWNRWTPLAHAAYHGHKETAELLLDRCAKIESQDKNRNTPLILAALNENGQKEIVKFLLDQGAYIESQNNDGNTPLAVAASNRRKSTMELLLDCHANIESKDKHGNTPLAYAASKGNFLIVESLQKNGANIESRNENGCTPLANAAAEGYTTIVQLLLESGAHTECKDNKGMTPLALAVQNGYKETADLLRKHGALEPTIFQRIRRWFSF